MTKLLLTLLLIILPISGIWSQEVVVSWDANKETDLDGYKIYYGVESGNYTNIVNVGNVTTKELSLLYNKTFYFVLTAYDINGNESENSNEVSITMPDLDKIPPNPPINIKIEIKIGENNG